MKKLAIFSLAQLAGQLCAPAAVTDNLVAYWNFEGGTANHASASGGTAYDGTLLGNAATSGTPKVGTGALLLDGTGDYMDVTTNVDVAQPWSVSAWFRSAVAPAGAVRGFVYESVQTASAGYAMSYGIREGTPTTNTNFQLFTDNTPTADVSANHQVADAETLNVWHHIVTVFTPATASVAGSIIGYLDGVQRYSLVIPAGDTMVAASGFHVGSFRGGNDRFFNGSIDEVAIWNRTLSEGEAVEVFSRGNQGETLTTVKYSVALSATPVGAGTVSGAGVYDPGDFVPILATPNPGYLFSGWTDGFNGQPASFTYTANASVTAIASFTEDNNDSDGDELSNYEEVVVYDTLPNNPDTDGDQIPDGAEVTTTGTNPKTSDEALVTFVEENLCPNPHAGAIALASTRIERDAGTGAISLFLEISGSADQETWQTINLSDPAVAITPAADGWTVTIPAPSSTVNSYVLLGSKR